MEEDEGVAGGINDVSTGEPDSFTAHRIFTAWLALDIVLWAFIYLSTGRGSETLAYIAVIVVSFSFLYRLMRRSHYTGGPLVFLLAILFMSLFEEYMAYSVGGGLHGKATSLAEDWIMSVPSFVGLGIGSLLARNILGANREDVYLGGAITGVTVEVLLSFLLSPDHGFMSLLASLVAFGGYAGWLYSALSSLPILEYPRKMPSRVISPFITSFLVLTCSLAMNFAGFVSATLLGV